MSQFNTTSKPFVRWLRGGPAWYGKWSRNGTPVMRALGPAWVVSDGDNGWRPKRGRPSDGALTEAQAATRMLELAREHDALATRLETDAAERRRRGATFRDLASAYLGWLEQVQAAKPSTLRDHRYLLAEPGAAHRRGHGVSRGLALSKLGDRVAAEVTTREVNALLASVAAAGASPRTVNKHRQLICAIYNYAARPATFDLAHNPATLADRRREPERAQLDYYGPGEIEALARTLAAGAHRDPSRSTLSDDERGARRAEDEQDAELIRVAAYAGLRRGELLALRWRDVDFPGHKLIVRRAISGDIEASSTKSRRAREVPLPDQAAGALARLTQRGDYVGPDDFVFCNRLGRRLDGSALRRRFERARDAAGLRRLRFHDLRHTYGSLLVAAGIDLASVKAAMGHSRITTTERYLHARPASELAERFTKAFETGVHPGLAAASLGRAAHDQIDEAGSL